MKHKTNTSLKYRPEIDGLRAIAVLSVMLFHAGFKEISGGFLGVDIFFVISGYLISKIILTEISAGTFTFKSFYERRVRRILPAQVVVVFVSLVIALVFLLPDDLVSLCKSAVATTVMLANVFFYHETDYFNTDSELEPLLHTWSLSVEEQYYLVFPAILLLHFKYLSQYIKLSFFILLMITLSLIYCEYTWRVDQDKNFYLLLTRVWELGVGGLLTIFETKKPITKKYSNEVFSFIGFFIIISSLFLYSKVIPVPSVFTLLPIIGVCLYLHFARADTYVGRLLASKAFVSIGIISYSLYLWHQPVLAFSKMIYGELSIETNAYNFALTFILAYLSWRYVEQPFRSKHTFQFKQVLLFVVPVSLLILAISFYVNATKGIPTRFSERAQLVIDKIDYNKHLQYFKKSREERKVDDTYKNIENLDKPLVIFIGDSYSEDLYNGFIQTKAFGNYQVRRFDVSSICELNISSTEINNYYKPQYKEFCKEQYKKNLKIPDITQYASIIIIAMRWKPFGVENIDQTYQLLNIKPYQKLYIFGTKEFKLPPKTQLIKMSDAELKQLTFKTSSFIISTNEQMRSKLPKNVFVDQQSIICDGNLDACHSFTDDAQLISHDGGHLTQAGAILVWKKFVKYLN